MNKYFIFLFLLFFIAGCESTPVQPIEGGRITIQYYVATTAHVRVTIENAYGTTVNTLVDKEQAYGIHSVQFTLEGHPEGVYYSVVAISGEMTIRKHLLVIAP